MIALVVLLIIFNCFVEYLLTRMLRDQGMMQGNRMVFHLGCSALRVTYTLAVAWFSIPIPIFQIGLLGLLFLTILPYQNRNYRWNHIIVSVYLIYLTIFMFMLGVAGLCGMDLEFLRGDRVARIAILGVNSFLFSVISFFMLHLRLDFFSQSELDRNRTVTYTQFLVICLLFHMGDALILTLCHTEQISYIYMLSGDILILFLLFNFMNYNSVFRKSDEARKKYEQSEVLMAKQYFEKRALKELSELDPLTRAYNRREIGSLMQECMNQNQEFICVFVDLDGLKRINDTYGHAQGDLMLKRFADASLNMLKEKGYLARIGGDEFLLIFLEQNMDHVQAQMQMLQKDLLTLEDVQERVSFSYGISAQEESVEQYILRADQNMYVDKDRKRCENL